MTERTVARQSLEDDAISLTSTQASEHEGTFKVVGILFERKRHPKPYLIKWRGYPQWKSTWEPKKNILDPSILASWKKRKEQERRGEKKPFDLDAFNEEVAKHTAEDDERRRRRRAKKNRLAVLVSNPDTELSEDNETGKDAAAINTGLESHKVLRIRKRRLDEDSSRIKANTGCRREKERKVSRAGTLPCTTLGNKEPIRSSPSSTKHRPTVTVARESSNPSARGDSSGGVQETPAVSQTTDNCAGKIPRDGVKIPLDSSVFSTKEQNYLIPSDSDRGGSLIHPIESCPPTAVSSQQSSTHTQSAGRISPPGKLPPNEDLTARGASWTPLTCFFWDRGWCKKGDSCRFLHAYERDIRIAQPPPGYVKRSRISRPFLANERLGCAGIRTGRGRSPRSASSESALICSLADSEAQSAHSQLGFQLRSLNQANGNNFSHGIELLFTKRLSPYTLSNDARRTIDQWGAGLRALRSC